MPEPSHHAAPPSASANDPKTSAATQADDAPAYEEQHVHAVYDRIAGHFSATRYKPWPIVARFLAAQPPGSIGLDVGCGNGKYFTSNPHILILGSDRSPELARIAASRTRSSGAEQADACVADTLALPHPRGRFDFGLAVAVVHHLSTGERRVQAVRALLEALVPWEGEGEAKRNSRRGWDAGMVQDVLVPWVMQNGERGGEGGKEERAKDSKDGENSTTTFRRFYHLYCEGELEEDVRAAGGEVLAAGYERDNWWVVAGRRA